MAISNYGQLKTAIAEWVIRDDLTAQIPNFISLFETSFNRQMRLVRMEEEATITQSGQQYAFPSDLGQISSVWNATASPTYPLKPVSKSFALTVSPQSGTDPVYYYTNGSALKIVPDNGANLGLRYYQKLPEMSADADTNWLLDEYPDAYLFGSLVEAHFFLVDEQRAALWQSRLNDIYEQIRQADAGLAWNEAARRVEGPTP